MERLHGLYKASFFLVVLPAQRKRMLHLQSKRRMPRSLAMQEYLHGMEQSNCRTAILPISATPANAVAGPLQRCCTVALQHRWVATPLQQHRCINVAAPWHRTVLAGNLTTSDVSLLPLKKAVCIHDPKEKRTKKKNTVLVRSNYQQYRHVYSSSYRPI